MSELLHSQQLPAVLVGGPPHSGKSVLIYSLSQALRERGVGHYALRACPDGEGDWSNEASLDLVREIRIKGQWTPEWVERIAADIDRRQFPLLVDVGGRPTPEQAALLGRCTGAILLTPDDETRAWWRELVHRYGVPVMAELTSDLWGENRLTAADPLVTGTLAGLERGGAASGPAFDALTARLAALFPSVDALRSRHLAAAPAEIELVVDLDRLACTLGYSKPGQALRWLPEQVAGLLEYLPAATPLAVYGRGTAWIQAALARLAWPERYYSFDSRLGWVAALPLPLGRPGGTAALRFTVHEKADVVVVSGELPAHYMDYSELDQVSAPGVAADKGVVLSGKLPYWLFTSLAISYQAAPWLAVYQPTLDGSVVIASSAGQPPLGTLWPG